MTEGDKERGRGDEGTGSDGTGQTNTGGEGRLTNLGADRLFGDDPYFIIPFFYFY